MLEIKPPVLKAEKIYPALSILYRVYVLDQVDQMSRDVDGYMKAFDASKEFIALMNGVAQGSEPNAETLKGFAEQVHQELVNHPRTW